MKYTEKADIAAKAVKVLDSVTMKRQSEMAKRYANQAIKCLLFDKNERRSIDQKSGFGWVFKSKASPTVGMIEEALDRMKSRLDKPRYTLKDGEWVRKTVTQKVAKAFGKEFDALRNDAMRSVASRPMPLYGLNSTISCLSSPVGISGRTSYSHSPIQAEWN